MIKIRTILSIIALFSFFTGFSGYSYLEHWWQASGYNQFIFSFSDSLYNTMQLFVLNGEMPTNFEAHPLANHLINVGRFLAPIALGGTILDLLFGLLTPRIEAFKMRYARKHILIFGTERYAIAFAQNALSQEETVILVAASNAQKERLNLLFPEVMSFVGESDRTESWEAVSAASAKCILLLNENDRSNIVAMKAISKIQSGKKPKTQRRVFTHIQNNELRLELVRQTGFFSSTEYFHFEPFSVPELAARHFFQTHDFFHNAWLRNQKNIHWLVFGLSAQSVAVLTQFLKMSPFAKLQKPKITLVCKAGNPYLDAMKETLSLCERFVDWEVCEPSHGDIATLSDEFCDRFRALDVTASLISSMNGQELELALQLRGRTQRDDTFVAPIYLSEFQSHDVDELVFGKMSNKLHDEIAPIAQLAQICDLQILTGIADQLAMEFHEDYLASLNKLDTRKASHRRWEDLDENFRYANRRAADHAKTKLEYLKVLGPLSSGRVLGLSCLTIDSNTSEALAIMEHNSWQIDRLMAGWKYAKDLSDFKRLHPDLVPFERLCESRKDYDRNQVRDLLDKYRTFSKQVSSLQANILIGIIGHNQIDEDEMRLMEKRLESDILPSILKRFISSQISFLTPLAPGSDLVMAQTVEKFLLSTPNQNHNIMVIDSVSRSDLLDGYIDSMRPGTIYSADCEINEFPKEMLSEKIGECRDNFCKDKTLIDISTAASKMHDSVFQSNADYFSSIPDIIIAYLDDKRSNHGPCGVKKTIQRAEELGKEIILI